MSKNRFDLNDEFWDIDDMLPKKKNGAFFSSDTEAHEITVKADKPSKGEVIPPPSPEVSDRLKAAREAMRLAEEKHRRYNALSEGDRSKSVPNEPSEPNSDAETPVLTYVPESSALIKEVTVKLWPSRYSFYETFREQAQYYFDKEGTECEMLPFFSFTPQYSQLTAEGLRSYFYFRSKIRRGEYIKADYSYVLLLVFEIINLPDRLSPDEGCKQLMFIWKSYRKDFPKLDRHMSEWVADYCLIHKLEPDNVDGEIVKAASAGSLKEFYAGLDCESTSPFASALLAYSSVYDYRQSKFITEENKKLFEAHIKNSVIYALSKVEKEHGSVVPSLPGRGVRLLKTVRDAYAGALCAYNVKRRIEVSYVSCSRSIELRKAVTDTVKFAENHVRAMLGIRSRFHTPDLSTHLKEAVKEYFAPYKKTAKKEKVIESVPEYDALYEPYNAELSLDDAKSIEERSWVTTELLTEGIEEFSDPEQTPERILPEENEGSAEAPQPREENTPFLPCSEDGYIKEALECLLKGDEKGFNDIAESKSMLPDALCEAINDRMYDVVADIVAENVNGKYSLIPDYIEEITEWMKK